jgi:hypothetical protein
MPGENIGPTVTAASLPEVEFEAGQFLEQAMLKAPIQQNPRFHPRITWQRCYAHWEFPKTPHCEIASKDHIGCTLGCRSIRCSD